MKNPLTASRLSAVMFSLVTLWAFWNLQDSGPEGTLKRFIEMAGNGNWTGINQILASSDEQLDTLTDEEKLLVQNARWFGKVGAYRVYPLRRTSRAALLAVEAEDPNGGVITTTWVLTRPSLNWTVDLKETVLAHS